MQPLTGHYIPTSDNIHKAATVSQWETDCEGETLDVCSWFIWSSQVVKSRGNKSMKHHPQWAVLQMHMFFLAEALCKLLKSLFSKGSSKVICKVVVNITGKKLKMSLTTHTTSMWQLRHISAWILFRCIKHIIHLCCFCCDTNGLEEFFWQPFQSWGV